MKVSKDKVLHVTGGLQLCIGQQAGCEAMIHTMNKIFSDSKCDAVLLVAIDPSNNAFNQLNHKAALQNIVHLCPSVAPAIVNN
jgi:hypothetical protein